MANRASHGYDATDDHESKRHAIDGRTECPKQTETKDEQRTSTWTIFQEVEYDFLKMVRLTLAQRMKTIQIIVCGIAIISVCGCASIHKPKGWSQVQLEMTQEEITLILGKPKSVFPGKAEMIKKVTSSLTLRDEHWPTRLVMLGALAFDSVVNPTEPYSEGWEYPPRRTRSFKPSYYVFFDKNGKVMKLSEPSDPDRQPLIDRK